MISLRQFVSRGLGFLLLLMGWQSGGAEFPTPYNTERPGRSPMSAAEAAASFRMPPGFRVSVFASEPDLQQPIAMTFDARGRLWVAENYTFAESKVTFATNLNDRVLIFEDTDNDGRYDVRKVFWDGAKILTSVEVGQGGVYALCPPQLLFFADRNGDDVPDGPPEVLVDGLQTTTGAHHTFANGLRWGPDGWLWGRVGITSTARIGVPGMPDNQRIEMRGGIWRYDPRQRRVEAVCHGTTNPWGFDWNEVGEPFFINTVIGHLWHAIPGAHFQRMFGDDVNPRSYRLIEQHADHYHFDVGAGWTHSRAAPDGSTFAAGSDALGGGHAHCGLLIYQADQWPAEYRGSLFTINLHGRRLNTERLERQGSGYVARHGKDLLSIGDPWFRGIDLIQGPDGSVFVSDWSDTGECHDNDGVHRTSGRIYKIRYGNDPLPRPRDLTQATDAELLNRLFDRNEWIARTARRVLVDRTANRPLAGSIQNALEEKFRSTTAVPERLRALWALHATGATPASWLRTHLEEPDDFVASWLVRLLADTAEAASGELDRDFERMAARPGMGLLKLYVAAALQKLPVNSRGRIAQALVNSAASADDHNLPALIWQGLEPAVAAAPEAAVAWFQSCSQPVLRQFVARRLTEELERQPVALGRLLEQASRSSADSALRQLDVLRGMADALRGWRKAAAPPNWATFATALRSTSSPEARDRVRDLGLLFGDGRALDALRDVVADTRADGLTRRQALQTLVDNRAEGVSTLLRRFVDDSVLRVGALTGLIQLSEPEAAKLAVARYSAAGLGDRQLLLNAFVSRPAAAQVLLEAIATGAIERADVTPFHARQMASLQDAEVTRRLAATWGSVRASGSDQRAAVARFRTEFGSERLRSADLGRGRRVFNQVCAPCHRLYGEGGQIGPDLTGSGRANLDYVLENVVDPSATVPAEYRMTVATLKDGRVLNGLLRDATERTVTLVSQTERLTLDRREVESLQASEQSMMPDGLLESLKPEEARDLVAYLMHPTQVALPAEK